MPLQSIWPDDIPIDHAEYRLYSRPFQEPLQTHHGTWTERTGIILKLFNAEGHVGFGEIAPLPWFGSETLADAIALCQTYGLTHSSPHHLPLPCHSPHHSISSPTSARLHSNDIFNIPDTHPACQFGFESAFESLVRVSERSGKSEPSCPLCHLLPTGPAALDSWQNPWHQGKRTFKWKIGVASCAEELRLFTQLIQQLPPTATLRLDANGALSWETANQWLRFCDMLSSVSMVECLEQPLPPSQFDELLALSRAYRTPVALDESVATLGQLQSCYAKGWRGLFVVKASIAGYPSRLHQFCQRHHVDILWSSVLETAIARQFIFNHLIPSVSPCPTHRALGFGVNHWFEPSPLDQSNPRQIWDALA